MAKHASKALAKVQHRISNVNVQVTAGAGWLQKDEPNPSLRMASLTFQLNDPKDEICDSSFVTTFTDLNDDCIAHMCKFLDLATLSAIADTSPRYANIATSVFNRHHKNYLRFDIGEPVDNARAFPIFGQFMQKVRITCPNIWNRHECNAKFRFYHKLINCYCQNVDELEWPYNRFYYVYNKYFPSLPIKKLKLSYMWDRRGYDVDQMGCLETIEHLILGKGWPNFYLADSMKYMPKLKTLHLSDISYIENIDLIACVQLKELKLGEVKIKDVRGYDRGYHNPAKIVEDTIIEIVRKLTQLKRLILVELDFVLSVHTYLAIVRIVRDTPNREKLEIHHYRSAPYDILSSAAADNKKFVEFHSTRPTQAELDFE